jgi:hypothetical protein
VVEISPRHDHEARVHERFARDTAQRIVLEDGVQHAIGDLVGDLVRVALGNGFRGEQVLVI